MSIDELIEEMRKRAARNLKLGYKVKFDLGEGVIFWDGTQHPPSIDGVDQGEANTTIRIEPDNLAKLIAGQLDPTMAYMTGKLKIEGSMGVALKLTGMFSE